MALSKYRAFNGSTDLIEFNLGNLAAASSVPQTFIAVVRQQSGSFDGEWIACPGFDPLDLFWIQGTGGVGYSDGPGFVGGPTVTAGGTTWTLIALRTPTAAVAKWSKSAYNGSSWPTPTHTTTAVTFSARTYPGAGTVEVGNTLGASFDAVCFARFNTSLADADINAMTAGVDAIKTTSGCTQLWYLGQSTPADLVGTSTLSSVTGATLSGTDSPFEGPAATTALIDPPLLVTATAVQRSYSW